MAISNTCLTSLYNMLQRERYAECATRRVYSCSVCKAIDLADLNIQDFAAVSIFSSLIIQNQKLMEADFIVVSTYYSSKDLKAREFVEEEEPSSMGPPIKEPHLQNTPYATARNTVSMTLLVIIITVMIIIVVLWAARSLYTQGTYYENTELKRVHRRA